MYALFVGLEDGKLVTFLVKKEEKGLGNGETITVFIQRRLFAEPYFE